MSAKYKVGDVLWFQPTYRTYGMKGYPPGYPVTVQKVGRVYMDVQGELLSSLSGLPGLRRHRVHIETGREAGDFHGGGQVWPSREAWDRHVAAVKAWEELQADMRGISWYEPPPGVTAGDVAEIRRLLRFKK